MDKEYYPTITKDLAEKATSDEAIEKLRGVDIEYQQKQAELDNIQLVQDGNFYMGQLIGLHSEKDAQSYATNREHAQLLLYDHYRCESEKIYEQFHPNDEKEPEEVFADSKEDVADYIKGYNEAHTLFHENKELADALDRSFEDKELSRTEGFQKCSEDLTREQMTQELDNLESRSLDVDRDKSRERYTDKDKND